MNSAVLSIWREGEGEERFLTVSSKRNEVTNILSLARTNIHVVAVTYV